MTLKSFKKLANKVIDQSEKMANQLLQSRIVLYIVFFLAVVYLFGLMLREDIPFTVIFLLIGFLTSFFSKNMIVIIFVAIVVSNVLKYMLDCGCKIYMNDINPDHDIIVLGTPQEYGLEFAKKNLNIK